MNPAGGFLNGQMPARQRGVVLAIALIFLLVLTLLGVAGFSSTVLEERMAGNLQAQTQAFQAAETGIVRIIANSGVFTTSDSCTPPGDLVSMGNVGTGATAKACRHFLQDLQPSRADVPAGAETVVFNHFRIPSVGETQTLARTTVAQGIRFMGPPGEGIFIETGDGS